MDLSRCVGSTTDLQLPLPDATPAEASTEADRVAVFASIFVLGGTGSDPGMSQLMSVERLGKLHLSECITISAS